ncbi:hypothetical protein DICVIV_04788 [Dictyocaulus viviparus]|uniref:Uncharacterized protein n=1 Tax=Dictyocaulus viviparus TaxID=29172 RepID=A0A0D8Y3C2_DICVI|nr:hypothetical protein DICVIV_04788 [Dictyocaulus viviparus]
MVQWHEMNSEEGNVEKMAKSTIGFINIPYGNNIIVLNNWNQCADPAGDQFFSYNTCCENQKHTFLKASKEQKGCKFLNHERMQEEP